MTATFSEFVDEMLLKVAAAYGLDPLECFEDLTHVAAVPTIGRISDEMVEAKLRPLRERVHAAIELKFDRWSAEHRAAPPGQDV